MPGRGRRSRDGKTGRIPITGLPPSQAHGARLAASLPSAWSRGAPANRMQSWWETPSVVPRANRPEPEPRLTRHRRAARDPKVALVHDFLVTDGGADQCAIEFSRLLPTATVHTSFYRERTFGGSIDPSRVRTWPLQRIFGPTDHFRAFLPLYPLWFSTLDLRDASLVLSSSIAFTKAVRTRRSAIHVSYIHTPLRYAWDLDNYLKGSSYGIGARAGARLLRPALRRWDRATASRPDVLVANSETVRDRIQRVWGRDSEVIYPPVNVDEIGISTLDDGYLLVAARMLAYRRLHLVVEAARRLGRQLVLVGDGPERRRLEAMAGPETRFVGHVSRPDLLDLFARCSAYVVPGEEDFGIAPVEAMAAGKPVVALRAGGARETVVDGVTGVFFDHPFVDELVEAITRLDTLSLDRLAIRKQAEQFDRRLFLDRWRSLFERLGVDPSSYSRG